MTKITVFCASFQGDRGSIGETGVDGDDGEKGPKGDVGAPGIRGAPGDTVSNTYSMHEQSVSNSEYRQS